MEIEATSLVDGVQQTIQALLSYGKQLERETGEWNLQKQDHTLMTEIHGYHLIITDPTKRWHNMVNRGLVTETLDFLLGDNPGFIQDVWSMYHKWQDRGPEYQYTYGARLQGLHEPINQWNQAVRILTEHPTSRQVVLVIRRPEDIIEKYQPCSIFVHFQLNSDEKLDMHWVMRSNDVDIGGLARNIFMNLHLFEQMSLATNLPMGTYYHYDTNVHFYEPTRVKLDSLITDLRESPFNTPATLLTASQKSRIRDALFYGLRIGDRDKANRTIPEISNPYYEGLVKFVLKEEPSLSETGWLETQEIQSR